MSQLKPKGSIRRPPRSIWTRYCKTILSSAKFLSPFSSAKDFYKWRPLEGIKNEVEECRLSSTSGNRVVYARS